MTRLPIGTYVTGKACTFSGTFLCRGQIIEADPKDSVLPYRIRVNDINTYWAKEVKLDKNHYLNEYFNQPI